MRQATKIDVETTYYDNDDVGHILEATAVFDDWEGDPDVVGGVHPLAPYLEDVTIDGEPTVDTVYFDALWSAVEALDGE